MANEYYVLATLSVRPLKMREFIEYWGGNLEMEGAQHLATFRTLVGREGTNTVMSLYKVTDVNAWFRGRTNRSFTPELDAYCTALDYTLMDKMPYSVLEEFLQDGEADSEENLNFYFWADIEVKSTRMVDYHKYWSGCGIELHHETGADHVGTFNIISGVSGTTHVKRLFQITDLQKWADGEVNTHDHEDFWGDVALNVWTTELYPVRYSHLR